MNEMRKTFLVVSSSQTQQSYLGFYFHPFIVGTLFHLIFDVIVKVACQLLHFFRQMLDALSWCALFKKMNFRVVVNALRKLFSFRRWIFRTILLKYHCLLSIFPCWDSNLLPSHKFLLCTKQACKVFYNCSRFYVISIIAKVLNGFQLKKIISKQRKKQVPYHNKESKRKPSKKLINIFTL